MRQTVFNYSDYRVFLVDYCNDRRKERAGWSLRVWARQLGLRSAAALAMILNGQRNPSKDLAKKLATNLKLNPTEARFFTDLVLLEKNKTDIEVSLPIMERLSQQKSGGEYQYLDPDAIRVMSQWHYAAIREMLHLNEFQDNPIWICQRLKFAITPDQATEAISALLRLGLIVRNSQGKLQITPENVDTPADTRDEGIKRYHEQTLENAKKSLRLVPETEREFYSTTFAMPKEEIPKAKELIRKFHRDFVRLLEKNKTDAVYQVEVAFFPIAEGGI